LDDTYSALSALAQRRWRMAVAISVFVVGVYFGFILLIAFDKEFVGQVIVPGLSVGIVLGALVIVATWITTWFYIRWANRHVDPALAKILGGAQR
jgi:uncharacterized membrane protein (DUF485 family)